MQVANTTTGPFLTDCKSLPGVWRVKVASFGSAVEDGVQKAAAAHSCASYRLPLLINWVTFPSIHCMALSSCMRDRALLES
jgi:hypothetical protein